MSPDRFYRNCYRILRVIMGIFYRLDVSGLETAPDGAAMVCANHSSRADPILVALAFGINRHIHFIAKVSLFKVPVLSSVLKKLGMISVNRDISDVSTVKNTLKFLKSGEKVAIFPEGRRVGEDNGVAAKNGAVKLAERAGVPIIPVFLPRKKPLFRKVPIVIGAAYSIEKQTEKRTAADYEKLSNELMDAIKNLNPEERRDT